MLFERSKKTLYIVAGAVFLIAILTVVLKLTGKKGSSGENGIPQFDTASVTEIKMTPKGGGGEVVFSKKEGGWQLKFPGEKGKTVQAGTQKVENMIYLLSDPDVKNIVSRNAADRKEYGLDTGYTSVKLFAGDELQLHAYIGKGEMLSQQEMGSYVRFEGSDDVFLVSGFLDMVFNSDLSLYRDRELGFGGVESWQEVKFSGDENFSLKRNGSSWLLEGEKPDSVKTEEYLQAFGALQGNEFEDNITLPQGKKPISQVEVTTVSGRNFTVSAFVVENDTLIATSMSKGSLFKGGGEGALYSKVFPGLKNFKSK